MFTGIITDIGTVRELHKIGNDLRIRVQSRLVSASHMQLGGSMAVNGVCLTLTDLSATDFSADVSMETLSCTTLGALQMDVPVNLEAALTPDTALGGHMVSGHVDGIAAVEAIKAEGRSYRCTFSAPQSLCKYIAVKGSITVDGVSLTVNAVAGQNFEVNIIPHTLERTIFKYYRPGTAVNLEVDLIARYLERLLESRKV